MVISNNDLTKLAIEEIIEKRNNLALQLRMRNYVGEKTVESLKIEIEALDKELEKRRVSGEWIRDEI